MDSLLHSKSGSVLQEDHVSQAITKNLNDVVSGKATYIDKLVFYAKGKEHWGEVAKTSQQRHEVDGLGSVRSSIEMGSTVIEIGPGDFKKTSEAFSTQITRYIAFDCNHESLKEHIPQLAKEYPGTCVLGICTTFEKAFIFLVSQASRGNIHPETTILWSFGSTIANYEPLEVIEIFKKCSQFAGQMWIGQDGNQNEKEIEATYHTREFKKFIAHGLRKADESLEKRCFGELSFANPTMWERKCSFNNGPTHHTWAISALQDIGRFEKGDTVFFMACYKYKLPALRRFCEKSGWHIESHIGCDTNAIYKIMRSSNAENHLSDSKAGLASLT